MSRKIYCQFYRKTNKDFLIFGHTYKNVSTDEGKKKQTVRCASLNTWQI